MSSVFLISTMPDSVRYRKYLTVDNMSTKIFELSVRGGAGLPTTKSAGWGDMSYSASGIPIWTPSAHATEVTQEQYETLKTIPVFKTHLENGKIVVLDKNPSSHDEIKKVTKNMEKHDNAKPITGADDPRIINKKIKISTGREDV